MANDSPNPIKIHLISLGCAKNQVDSERMLFDLAAAGIVQVEDPEEADVGIVNTCGFIESAKAEAIAEILELVELKKAGKLKAVVASGCLTERYREEFAKELPEVDAVLGAGSFDDIVDAVRAVYAGGHYSAFGDVNVSRQEGGRVLTTPGYTAYLKIAEGCDNRCAYCVIPDLRGRFRSRPIESLVKEAQELAAAGVKELIVVAQDITRYGTDLYGERALSRLLEQLCAIDGIRWIRLHYLYPDEIDEKLIDEIAKQDKIVKYLDIPIQHINDRILKAMRRRGTGGEIRALFAKLRSRIPGLVLRTSLIVGLPGETEAEFEQLCDFLREFQIERAGVFCYSPEEGSDAALMPDQVDEDTKTQRREIAEEIASRAMDAYNEKMLGRTITVLCEGYDRAASCCVGRSYADSPDIDGKVFFTVPPKQTVRAGTFCEVEIDDSVYGDLAGKWKGQSC